MKLKPFQACWIFILFMILAVLFPHSSLLRVNKAAGMISGMQEKGGVVTPKPKPAPKPASSPPTRRNQSKLSSRAKSRQASCEARSPTRGTGREHSVDLGDGVKLEMVEIPPGSFCMGSTSGDKNENPVHRVAINNSFYMGRYEVTVAEWLAVMGQLPELLLEMTHWNDLYASKRQPIVTTSWNDAQEFIRRLNTRGNGYIFRLPTEAEWEYACRAGTTTVFAFGNSLSSAQANFDGNFPYGGAAKGIHRGNTIIVGSFQPNNFGLYDMHGNPWEWCQDFYHQNYYGAPVDGSAWEHGGTQERVLRGGGWNNKASSCRSAVRYSSPVTERYALIGFRVVAVARSS
jgi:formylglycine-generating enzyme required for sulfatase activity